MCMRYLVSQLFRKDLISAMKLPDSEPLSPDEYWVITDQWKQDWERRVQVPVNPDSLPEPTVNLSVNAIPRPHQEFKLTQSTRLILSCDCHIPIISSNTVFTIFIR